MPLALASGNPSRPMRVNSLWAVALPSGNQLQILFRGLLCCPVDISLSGCNWEVPGHSTKYTKKKKLTTKIKFWCSWPLTALPLQAWACCGKASAWIAGAGTHYWRCRAISNWCTQKIYWLLPAVAVQQHHEVWEGLLRCALCVKPIMQIVTLYYCFRKFGASPLAYSISGDFGC